jgi:hypothetical protein
MRDISFAMRSPSVRPAPHHRVRIASRTSGMLYHGMQIVREHGGHIEMDCQKRDEALKTELPRRRIRCKLEPHGSQPDTDE